MAERLSVLVAWLGSNPYTKALAALIAVTAWLFVQQDVAREAVVPVRIQWSLPDDTVPLEPLRSQITLRVVGPRAATKRVRERPIVKTIDLKPLPLGEHVVDLAGQDWATVPSTLRITGVEPPSLTVELDELVEQKVPVEVRQVGLPSAAFHVRDVSVDPAVVLVEGPRSVISRLERVVTKPLDVSGVRDRTVVDAPLDLPRGVSVVGEVPRATIDVVVVEGTVENLRVEVIVRGSVGYAPSPSHVEVSLTGPIPVLSTIDAEDVVAFVRLDGDPPESGEVRYGPERGARIEIWHPGGPQVAVASVEPPVVRVERP